MWEEPSIYLFGFCSYTSAGTHQSPTTTLAMLAKSSRPLLFSSNRSLCTCVCVCVRACVRVYSLSPFPSFSLALSLSLTHSLSLTLSLSLSLSLFDTRAHTQLDEYCNGGSMDWSGKGDSSKLDYGCLEEPELHKLLKVLSSYGVEGTVTMSEKGKKTPTVLVQLDLCSLVPEAGKGLSSRGNKDMLLAAAVTCPTSSSRRSSLANHAPSISAQETRLYCRPTSEPNVLQAHSTAVCSAGPLRWPMSVRAAQGRAAQGRVAQYQPCKVVFCVYVCVRVCVCACVRVYVCICLHTHTHTHI